MVSLSRLLAAADDAPLDERAISPPPTRLPRDCVIPPALSQDSIPPTLRLALSSSSREPISSVAQSSSIPIQVLLRDLGPEATEPRSMSILAKALAHFGRPSEAAVTSALLFLTTSASQESSSEDTHTSFQLFSLFCSQPENPSLDRGVQQAVSATNASVEWRPDVFVQAVISVAAQFNDPLDWRLVVRSLDMEGLSSRLTRPAFIEIAKAYMSGTGGTTLPADCLVSNWRYTDAQLCVLKHALSSPSIVNWDVLDAFEGATPEDLNTPYARVSLVGKLVELNAYDMLQDAMKERSDVLLLSLACAKPRNNSSVQQKLTVTILTPLISMFPSSKETLRKMWNLTPTLVEAGIISMWKKDPTTLPKALTMSLELHILPDLLSTGSSLEFSLELALVAYQHDVLKLESWLSDMLKARGYQAINLCTMFMANKLRPGCEFPSASQLSVDAVRIMFRGLVSYIQSIGGAQGQEQMDGLRDVLDAYTRLNARIGDLNPALDIGDRSVLVNSDLGLGFASSPPSVPLPVSMAVTASSSGMHSVVGRRNEHRGLGIDGLGPEGVIGAGVAPTAIPGSIPDGVPGALPGVISGVDQTISGAPPGHPPMDEALGTDAAAMAAAMLYPLPESRDGGGGGFPDAVDKEADVFFQKLYRGEMPPEQAVEILRTLKLSESAEDRDVFNCALHTLFDEYRFFLKYPDRELKITGMLFGSVIQHSLIQGSILGLAIRCVLDALRTVEPAPHPIGRYAKFGLCALERFRGRLSEWPQYCSYILDINRLKSVAPELIIEVRKALATSGVPPTDVKNTFTANVDSDSNIDTILVPDDGAPPPVTLADPADSANNVQSLLASPTLSATHTPVKGSMSSTSLRASPSVNVDGSLGLSALNLITLLGMTAEEAAQILEPDEHTQDKIKFIFNNLSAATMDDKVKEVIAILRPEYQKYFSLYIVVKRASSESNFHHLYLTMLDMIEAHLPALFPMVYDTSYRRVRVLLSGDKIKTSSSERVVLKSLGSWIGSLTLARNKPILRRDLDMKELLMDAYSNGRLTTVVPFVTKVLEACPRSKIFKTSNPWVRGILGLMKEIYTVDDLKLNMKFELQLLCKALSIDVSEISPSDLLRGRPAPNKDHNPDFNTRRQPGVSPPQTSPSPTASPSPELSRPYLPTGPNTRPGVPVFTLTEAQSASASHPIPLATGQSGISSRLDVAPSLVSGNMAMGGDVASELSSILANTSIAPNIPSNALQRNAMHVQGTMGIASTGNPVASQRTTVPMTSTEPLLLPSLSQYVQISPSLVLFQTSPHLKRAIPYAIDRAIREIIQPVVERSCAIAFLTTKELTLKDFANEPDMGKIRRAALQMVQQLAGSLALVTSKEPLRVSMGNQIRLLLSPVGADQNLIEQTAQMVCASNLDIGCAIIERHAKEKAARDLSEKIGPAFSNRRPQHSVYAGGVIPGPEVHRTYEEFSRVHRASSPPAQQYEPSQAMSPTMHSMHQSQVPATTSASIPIPGTNHLQSRLIQNIPDHRINGAALDPKIEPRVPPAMVPPQQLVQHAARGASDLDRNKPVGYSLTGPRRASPSPPVPSEPPASTSMYGTALPEMASPTSVAAAILAAAGSSNASGSSNSHALASASVTGGLAPGEVALSTQQVLERFNLIYPQISPLVAEVVFAGSPDLSVADLPPEHQLHSLWIQIPAAVKRSVTADEAGMAVAQKVFKGLYEADFGLHREIHVMILDGLRESCRRLSKEISSWLAFSEDRKKLNKECIVALMKPSGLLNITAYDEVLAKALDNGRNASAMDFACFLVRRAIIEEPLATAAELYMTLETMAKIGRRSNPPSVTSCPEGLTSLVDAARSATHKPTAVASSPSSSTTVAGNEISHSAAKKDAEPTDHTGAREYVAGLLLEWQRIISKDVPDRMVPDHVMEFLSQIRENLISSEESRERFCRLTIELTCNVTRTALHAKGGSSPIANDLVKAPYTIVEAIVRLVGSLCRSDGVALVDGKMDSEILCFFLIALVKDIIRSGPGADLRPHFRLLSGLISEFAVGLALRDGPVDFTNVNVSYFNPTLADRLSLIGGKEDAIQFLDDVNMGFVPFVRNSAHVDFGRDLASTAENIPVVMSFVAALTACAPCVAPSFVFSWLQLISNKELLPSLLAISTTYGWPIFRHLLVKMLEFLSKFLGEPGKPLSKGLLTLYSGLLRVLLVLLHDFPEFLCAYHITLCNAIPPNCVQLRNLVLASFPKDMRLPDPFLPELNVEELPDMGHQPLILSDYIPELEEAGISAMLVNYLRHGNTNGGSDVKSLIDVLEGATRDAKYCVQLYGSLVMYVGQFAVSASSSGSNEAPRINSLASQLFRTLNIELGAEARHYLLNAVANQLRYPNSHTMFHSNLMLVLFHEAYDETIKEQITRVLVERLIANRPHPWGLLVTFVQLIKKAEYNFWGHGFVRCAPEIEQLFENVAKFCVGPVTQSKPQSIVAAS